MAYTIAQLENLWVQAGGNPLYAPMAAAVAMAESGGDPNASHSNSNGSIDRGLWQINSIHGSQSTFDVTANARAAVGISSNGTNWRPWCTAWSNGDCSGSFMGPGAPIFKFLDSAQSTSPDTSGGTSTTALPNPLSTLDPNTWVAAIFKPIAVWGFYGGMFIAGLLIMLWGIAIMISQSRTADSAKQVLGLAAANRSPAKSAPVKSAPVKSAPAEKSPTKTYTPKHSREGQ